MAGRTNRDRRQDTADQVISRDELRSKLLPAAPDRYRAITATAAGAGLRWGEAAGLRRDALDLDHARLSVIRTVIEVGGHTSFKPYPKSGAGRGPCHFPVGWCRSSASTSTVLGASRRSGLREHRRQATAPNFVPRPRVASWAGASGMLGTLTVVDEDTVRGCWTDATGATLAKEFPTEQDAVLHIARSCASGFRFHDLRHSYATSLDDGVPVNMVQRVMGHERSSTTLDLYIRRTDDHGRILQARDDGDESDDDFC